MISTSLERTHINCTVRTVVHALELLDIRCDLKNLDGHFGSECRQYSAFSWLLLLGVDADSGLHDGTHQRPLRAFTLQVIKTNSFGLVLSKSISGRQEYDAS